MATTYTSNYAAPGYFAAGHGCGNDLKFATGSYALTGALVVNDVIQMVKVPAGATVLDVLLVAGDLDTGGSPALTLHVGYGGDPDYWVVSSTVGQAGGLARASAATAVPLTFTAEDTIDVLVAVAPATGATTGTIYLTVYYTMP